MKINKTSNYAMFDLDVSQNREINAGLIKKLTRSITAKNLLVDKPILVKKNGNGYLILDGQHRFEAARILGIPFYFIESTETEFVDIPNLQGSRKGWSPIDYINVYVNKGNTDYQYLKSILLKGYKVTTALAICFYYNPNTRFNSQISFIVSTIVKTGKFKADISKTNRLLSLLDDFKRFKHYKDRSFVYAILSMMKNKFYDHSQMLRKIDYTEIERRACKDDYIKQMEEIYNYKSRVRIRFI